MPFSMNLWKVGSDGLTAVSRSALDQEERLERWVTKDPMLLGIKVLIVGQQVITASGGRIDLLAINGDGDVMVIELKRDRTPRDVVAQALDYAAWAKELSYESLDKLCGDYRGKPLAQAFSECFGVAMPESINDNHSILVLASELDESSERIVHYLASEYGVPINVVFFTFFREQGEEFVGRAWLRDPEEVQENARAKKQPPPSGYYFINIGKPEHRKSSPFPVL